MSATLTQQLGNPPYEDVKTFNIAANKNVRRLLITGETRIGKSSLCDKIAGCFFEQIEKDDGDLEIKLREGTEMFKTGDSNRSVTEKSSWAEVFFLGDKQRPLLIVDTPGVSDSGKKDNSKDEKDNSEEEKDEKIIEDLVRKLNCLKYINGVLILLGKNSIGGGGGFNKATLKMIQEIYGLFSTNKNIDKHIMFAFCCCDEDDKSWKQSFKKKNLNGNSILKRNLDEMIFLFIHLAVYKKKEVMIGHTKTNLKSFGQILHNYQL